MQVNKGMHYVNRQNYCVDTNGTVKRMVSDHEFYNSYVNDIPML